MPKYTFSCDACDTVRQTYVDKTCETLKCECGGTLKRKLPTIGGPAQVTEVVDKYTGVKWKQDQKDMLHERKSDYYWEVEVPRMVNSGIYTLETMLENGWVYINDKGEICTRNKPPQRD